MNGVGDTSIERHTLEGFGRALGLGLLSGSRSATPLAIYSRATAGNTMSESENASFRWLRSPRFVKLATLLVAGETIGDKLPFTPNRTSPGALFGRAASGALVGAASCRAAGLWAPLGFALGAASAVLGSFAAYRARASIDARTGLPEPLVGAAEDAFAVCASIGVMRRPWIGFAVAGLAMRAVSLKRPEQPAP